MRYGSCTPILQTTKSQLLSTSALMIQAYQLNCSDKLQIKMRFGSYECALIVNYLVSTFPLNKYTIYMVILKGMALASTFILTLPSGFKSK